ncbi:hypothetical protein H6H03_21060 [Nostoc paludosum FACHB-159]|uniref:Uncharacterized protein n=1 Tax=Nostoc paludosum FACHB-159 TaxID=2692908 RepID=A0ABR8KBX5_9NOSO|nr:hypothetical protein [Nostoc paludosum FACHB-159]
MTKDSQQENSHTSNGIAIYVDKNKNWVLSTYDANYLSGVFVKEFKLFNLKLTTNND